MERRRTPGEPQEERGPRERTSQRLGDTRAPLVLRDGTSPPWFQGRISRKEAEDLVKDKPVGCFLIRLSDKAIGYILSYRGQDRCRHFVITQNKVGQLIVSGDTETHDSMANLIEYYKTCPIEPFGEKLTTSCFQAPSSELYDMVQGRPTVSVKALKDMWSNHTHHRTPDRTPNQTPDHTPNQTPDHTPNRDFPPALPPKTCNSRAAPMTSYDINTPPEILPRQPRGGAVLRNSLSSSQNGQTVAYAQLVHGKSDAKAKHLRRARPNAQEMKPRGGVVPAMPTVYSELNLETSRSISLPFFDQSPGAKHPYRHTSFNTLKPSPSPSKRVTCQTYSLLDPREHFRQPPAQGLPSSCSLDKLNINPLYQSAWENCRWGPPVSQQDQDAYAQVPHEPLPARSVTDNTYEPIPDQSVRISSRTHPSVSNTYELIPDQCLRGSSLTNLSVSNTYELIPDQSVRGSSHTHPSVSNTYELVPDQRLRDGPLSNTYEMLNDLQPKKSGGMKADKWLRFFTEQKKK
ncbi:SH2 domain-containing protein 7-like [Conger conger]|uniref:SH2 domain-containing protein 7-like n=1 Tax=Conger conger TaxID=82655 RepID=UPI002A59E1E5|nr:SH2 domain-containing protein 7-like [Conger conger]